MYCSYCGAQNPDDASFCRNCGKAVALTPQPQPQSKPQFQYPPQPQPQPQAPELSPAVQWRRRMDEYLGNLLTSPTLLIAIILFTASMLITLFAGTNSFETLLGEVGISEYSSIFEDVDVGSTVITLLANTPAMLVVVGLWMIYGGAKSGMRTGVVVSGFQIIRVVEIIMMVGAWIVMGWLTVVIIGYELPFSVVVTSLSIIALGCVLLGMMCRKILLTLVTMRETVDGKIPDADVSAFLAVLLFIIGSICIYAGVRADFDLASMCIGVALILFGSLIFGWRSKMRKMQVEFVRFRKEHEAK